MLAQADGVFSCVSLDPHVELLALKTFVICSWKTWPDAMQLLCACAIAVHMDLVMAVSVHSSAMASESRCNSGQVPLLPLGTSPLILLFCHFSPFC